EFVEQIAERMETANDAIQEDEREKCDRDRNVDGRPGDRDEQLAFWLHRHLLDEGGAAERKERDVANADPEFLRHQAVTELVKHDTAEHKRHQNDAIRQGAQRATARHPEVVDDPKQHKAERRMNVEVNPPYAADWETLHHRRHRSAAHRLASSAVAH